MLTAESLAVARVDDADFKSIEIRVQQPKASVTLAQRQPGIATLSL